MNSVMFCDILRSCRIFCPMAGWLCDLDAKTATLVHGAHGVRAALGFNDVFDSSISVCFLFCLFVDLSF